jgi:hypothetical protein
LPAKAGAEHVAAAFAAVMGEYITFGGGDGGLRAEKAKCSSLS